MPRRGQERAALALICGVPLIIIIAFAVRQDPDALAAPVLLEAPQ